MDYSLSRACKDVGTYFLNQFPQYKVKNFRPEVYAHIYPLIKTLIYLENLKSTPRLGRLVSFIGNWLKKKSDPVNQEILKWYFLDSESFQVLPHPSISMAQENAIFADQ